VSIREEMVIVARVVDPSMVCQSFVWVRGAILTAPVDVLPLQGCCFHVWNMEDSDFHAILVGFSS
jgi:hypothetical protein